MATGAYTDIELMVIKWLTKHKIPFETESPLMGGSFELGGAVVDILLRERRLVWRVMGEFWHGGIEKRGSDLIQRESLAAKGWVVVDLWGHDLETPDEVNQTLTKALRGEEMLR